MTEEGMNAWRLRITVDHLPYPTSISQYKKNISTKESQLDTGAEVQSYISRFGTKTKTDLPALISQMILNSVPPSTRLLFKLLNAFNVLPINENRKNAISRQTENFGFLCLSLEFVYLPPFPNP